MYQPKRPQPRMLMAGKADAAIEVSMHAVLRWLERVERHDVGGIRKALGGKNKTVADAFVVHEICEQFGYDVAILKRRIATPAVRMAMAHGASLVTENGISRYLQGQTVTTVVCGKRRTKQ